MNKKHVPGPWHVHWPGDDGFPEVMDPRVWPATFLVEFGETGEDYGGFMVCGWNGSPRERDGKLETYEPTVCAALIAAAPELLRSLEIAADWLADKGVPADHVEMIRIRAAIAKVEMESESSPSE